MKSGIVLIAFTFLCACAYLPGVKNRLYVVPVKNGFGVEPHETDTFQVVVGWGKLEEIVKTKEKPLPQEAKERFFNFAVEHIISIDYCEDAEAIEYLSGWEGNGDRGVLVKCK